MNKVLIVALAGQMAAMTIDEFHFHWKRGLPLWERIGHPIDTAVTATALGIAAFSTPSPNAIHWYAATAILSCAVITKDEFVHARLCSGQEHWLHAVLFILHPIVLAVVALAWISAFASSQELIRLAVALEIGFMLYQITYWNFLWQVPKKELR